MFLILNGDLRATQRSEITENSCCVQYGVCFPSVPTVSAKAFHSGKVLCWPLWRKASPGAGVATANSTWECGAGHDWQETVPDWARSSSAQRLFPGTHGGRSHSPCHFEERWRCSHFFILLIIFFNYKSDCAYFQ